MKTQRLTCLLMSVALCVVPSSARADGEELVTQIVNLLSNPDREFRAAALEAVRSSAKGTSQTQTFAAELPKLDAEAQAALITALGDRGDVAARPAILEQLAGSKNEAVRAAALAALGEIGSTSDLPALVNALGACRMPNSKQRRQRWFACVSFGCEDNCNRLENSSAGGAQQADRDSCGTLRHQRNSGNHCGDHGYRQRCSDRRHERAWPNRQARTIGSDVAWCADGIQRRGT